ncbi:carbohydrate ABC transporter permease [Acetanaerobacterium elongatum]|uniref:Carbohydrate ABC transporter membrane protein 1, CUT1 family n=1 Tax=Acetanaerobacterium elongatum TaxID=258515 RepID=A0A1H0DS50_9FIRM|nr:sugar ABC transporter permease [Acetanaerobacterium elongatum]SDN73067.1 carbohydrate ABC transporter membrane protein 1, CUT1 family [Acetanaerobacterium elongatum]
MLRDNKFKIWPYLLILPALIIVLAVVFIPAVNAILMSFQNYDLRRPKDIGFIGLENYISVFQDGLFWSSLAKTFIWVIVGVGFQFLFGFALALLLNRQFYGRGLARSVSLIPWVTPGVLIGLMWRWIFDGNYGVLNDVLLRLGVIQEKIPFLAQESTSLPAVIVTIIWQGIPFFALMILAGLQGIPGELYEAADIDGASGVQKLFNITIPSLSNTIFITTLLRIIWVANSVDVIYNMTEGGPYYATQTLSVYIFNKGNSLNLGYSSTMSVLMTLLLLTVAVPYLKNLFKKQEE